MNLKSLLPKKKVLSLDIGSYQIKGVVGRETKKGIIIDNYFTIPTPKEAYNDGEIVDKELVHYVIDEELKKNKIKIKDTYLTINSSKIITREVTIPKVKPEEIANILSYQISDYIPMNPENYIVQYSIIDLIYENDVEKLSILLIGIPKAIVENHLQLLKNLDLNPLVLDYQPNSIAKLIKFSNFINVDYPTEDITFATIDIGYDNTTISIIRNGTVYVSRVIEIGGKYIEQSILNFFEYDEDELKEVKGKFDSINQDVESQEYTSVFNIIKDSLNSLNERIEIVFRYFLSRETGNQIHMI
ncbi:pilus assembly protein PilM, partial [Schnuerera sp.]|uniref:pilus assembly protein PilM n=1 Tax=Schnuerera sp. TaxID=2794844 RepID=UPI002C76F06E